MLTGPETFRGPSESVQGAGTPPPIRKDGGFSGPASTSHLHERVAADRAALQFEEPFDGDTAYERDQLWHGDEPFYLDDWR